jgi:hypothetical protein
MAKAVGILGIEGTIENLTFYRRDGKLFVRRKGGVSKHRIETDPNYVRTRENMNEFKQSATSGRLLRVALHGLVIKAKDNRLSSRMFQTMFRIKNLDATSARGNRRVAIGLSTPAGKTCLKGFDFNANAPLKGVLFAPFDLEPTSGTIAFTGFISAAELLFPEGATHASIQVAALAIDFDTAISEITYSAIENFTLSMTPSTFSLTPSSLPSGGAVTLFLLNVAFFQEVGGVQYPMKNEEFNVLNIIEVL